MLVCNWLGMVMGMMTVRWVGSLEYKWDGLSKQTTIVAKVRSFVQISVAFICIAPSPLVCVPAVSNCKSGIYLAR